MKAYSGSRRIAPLILNLCTKMSWVVNVTTEPTACTDGFDEEKISWCCRDSNPDRPGSIQSLHRQCYPGYFMISVPDSTCLPATFHYYYIIRFLLWKNDANKNWVPSHVTNTITGALCGYHFGISHSRHIWISDEMELRTIKLAVAIGKQSICHFSP